MSAALFTLTVLLSAACTDSNVGDTSLDSGTLHDGGMEVGDDGDGGGGACEAQRVNACSFGASATGIEQRRTVLWDGALRR